MKVICITLDDDYVRVIGSNTPRAATRVHLAARGVDAQFFKGVDAAKLGLVTTHPYTFDDPNSTLIAEPRVVGCWLSHRAVWSACLLADLIEDEFLIIEDDAKFPENWKERYEAARVALPPDWDVLFLGSCCTAGRPTRHVAGDVYEVEWPLCLHAYLVRRRALGTMVATQDDCWGPIDVTLFARTWPLLRVYTVLPRIIDQFDMVLPV